MIGIIGALEEEVILLKHDMQITKVEIIGKCEYVSGLIKGIEVVVVKCGMGKVNAAICATVMIERYKTNFILNTGVGGSLKPSYKVLDIMIAKELVQHDYNLVPLGYQLGQIDNFDSPILKCDEQICALLKKTTDKFNLPSYLTRFATGDQFINQQKNIDYIVKNFNADLCDMESCSIAQVCTLYKVKYAIIRTISDSSHEMEFQKFLKHASTQAVKIVEDLVANIHSIL